MPRARGGWKRLSPSRVGGRELVDYGTRKVSGSQPKKQFRSPPFFLPRAGQGGRSVVRSMALPRIPMKLRKRRWSDSPLPEFHPDPRDRIRALKKGSTLPSNLPLARSNCPKFWGLDAVDCSSRREKGCPRRQSASQRVAALLEPANRSCNAAVSHMVLSRIGRGASQLNSEAFHMPHCA